MKTAIRLWALRGLIFTAAVAVWFAAAPGSARSAKSWNWYKGNLHTHTTHSDGDSSPAFVARWYKEHHYQFLVLSDHNYFTDPRGLNSFIAAKDRFLLIGGEEVTSHFEKLPIHVNAYGIGGLIPPRFGRSVVETIQRNVSAIAEAGGIPSLNHPDFGWAVTSKDLAAVDGLALFEVYNGHPTVHNEGGGGSPSLEQMWDYALTAGRRLFAVAVDDAHYFKRFGPEFSNPGRGWVVVKAPEHTGDAILRALRAGDFYASTGVKLADVVRDGRTLRVEIDRRSNFKYTVRYVGAGGKLLAESFDLASEYTLKPGERYVRATITDSMGWRAWTQPVFAD